MQFLAILPKLSPPASSLHLGNPGICHLKLHWYHSFHIYFHFQRLPPQKTITFENVLFLTQFKNFSISQKSCVSFLTYSCFINFKSCHVIMSISTQGRETFLIHLRISMKVANIDREILHNVWTTWGTSMKFSEKMWLMIILKVTKNRVSPFL